MKKKEEQLQISLDRVKLQKHVTSFVVFKNLQLMK